MSDIQKFSQELKGKHLSGFWERGVDESNYEPIASFPPHLWKWDDVRAAIHKAGEIVPLELSPRRVVQLVNPALKFGSTHTLGLNIQMLKPGEHAPPHRHTMGAIRFIIEGRGAHCVVDGEPFEIEEGDFLTTPGWCWHDHYNDSEQTHLWLDGVDAPLMNYLQARFFETQEGKGQAITRPKGTTPHEMGPIRPTWVRTDSNQPPGFSYRWKDAEKVLKAVGERPGDPYDGILLNYVNPLTGGPTLPTMSCALQMLRPGERTEPHRHTSSTIYYVFRGKGATIVGDQRLEWQAGDSFVVPLWYPHKHENPSDKESILFVMNDRPLLEALGFYRERTVE